MNNHNAPYGRVLAGALVVLFTLMYVTSIALTASSEPHDLCLRAFMALERPPAVVERSGFSPPILPTGKPPRAEREFGKDGP